MADTSLAALFAHNAPFVAPGQHAYNTPLPAPVEQQFRGWVDQNHVPFDPNASVSDYDMRGFWQALQSQDPRAMTGVNPNDGRLHYPDYWKTPYHRSFSAESQWAGPQAPRWNGADQLVTPDGRVVFDERRPQFGDVVGGR